MTRPTPRTSPPQIRRRSWGCSDEIEAWKSGAHQLQAGLTFPSADGLERLLELEEQLAAMTAARNHVCRIATVALGHLCQIEHPADWQADVDLIASLRKVGAL